MFIKLSVIFSILQVAVAQNENHEWDLAVVTSDKIELLFSNGSLIESSLQLFNKLKALTFDNVRRQFIVSDMDDHNDTIFTVQLTKETDITPIIEDLPDDVQGLAIDPIADILYWTDSINRTINYIHLNDSTYQSTNLFNFRDENPLDIAIDVCHRYIYWTNSHDKKSTIERARLDGSEHQVLVDEDVHRPTGISIDYTSQRLFWADQKEGIYYTIESSTLEGKEREVVYQGTFAKPFGIAVDSEAIYFTDSTYKRLWMISKFDKDPQPKILRQFKEQPMGIVAKNVQITSFPECDELSKLLLVSYQGPIKEVFTTEANYQVTCLNGGYLVDDDSCNCPRGYTGQFCEVSLCHNYCVHGDCSTSSMGRQQCRCKRGYRGERCAIDVCDGFCLNGGACSHFLRTAEIPTCNCQEGFTGPRCETALDVCDVFCQGRNNDVLVSEQNEVICRCVGGSAEAIRSNFTSLPLSAKQPHPLFFDHFQDTAFLSLTCVLFIMLVTIIVLAAYTCSLRRRPRIKKRIIVNKNITPLTYRPQPTTEHCEITIENCCNMNICDTPCFEPPQLRCLQNKNEDKKKLLSNMENGEEMY